VDQTLTLSGSSTEMVASPPSLSFSPSDTLRFGVLGANQSERQPLELRNRGGGTLKVLLRSESGEFVPEDRDTIRVEPGQSYRALIRFTPTRTGTRRANLLLSTNDPQQPLASLVMQGGGGGLYFDPPSLVFGEVKVGERKDTTVTLFNQTAGALTVRLSLPAGDFSVDRLSARIDAGKSLVLRLSFRPRQVGQKVARLAVQGRDLGLDLAGTGVEVMVSPPVLSYTPSDTLRFGVVGPNQSELKPVEIRNSGQSTLKVLLRSESGEFIPEDRDTLRVEAGQSYRALIRFTPTRTGTRRANLLISSNDPQKPLSNLVMQGGGGGLYFDPPSIVFGEVRLGVKKDTTVLLVNQTASALTVRLNLPAGDFSADRLSARIDAGKSLVLRLSFRPRQVGQKVARLAVQGRDLGLDLAGTGVEEAMAPTGGLQLSATSLTMDNTRVRSTSRKSLIVSNTSTQNISLALSLSGPNANQFRVSPTRQTLTPGQRKSFTLTFMPTSTGAKRATLTLAPSTGSPLTVALSGTAIATTSSGLSAREEAAKPAGSGGLVLALGNNYPNPFNPVTTIGYSLAEAAPVRLVVYNLLGRQVRVLVDEVQGVGRYAVEWDGLDEAGLAVSSGVYFYRLEAGPFRAVRKMLLAR
jgi:hypothetical protein